MSRTSHGLMALLFVGAAGAQASVPLTANMTNGQENPPVSPTTSTGAPRPISFGNATFLINDAMNSMSFSAMVNNIDVTGLQTADVNDNLVAAHIHAPAPPGANSPVVWGFFGTPMNDNQPMNVTLTPFASGVGGTFAGTWDTLEGNNTTFTAQVQNILAGLSYINFHTTQFAGGEIRGQITVVPEPETYALMLAGLGAMGLLARRRKGSGASR